MTDANDMELLRDYDRHGSEAAFAALVQRHIHLVYSVALRHTGMAAHAEEITQAVFIILARKAASLRPDTILEGWLHETTRLTALSFLRGERRRQFREQEAYMQSTLPPADDAALWNQLAPMLDEAVSQLGRKDRDAVMLRFFKDKNLREVAAALDMTEAAAQRRVHRAVERLRGFFTKRGVTLTATVLTAAISANSVHAAPLGLVAKVTATAVKGAVVSGSTLTLIKGALKVMAWTKMKTAIVVGAAILLAGGTTFVAVNTDRDTGGGYSWQVFDPSLAGLVLSNTPPQVTIVPTRFSKGGTLNGRRIGSWGNALRNGKTIGMNCPAGEIIRYAMEDYPRARTMVEGKVLKADGMPERGYDFIANLPNDSRAALKVEAEQKLGLTGNIENRETDVLVLKVKTVTALDDLQGTWVAGEGNSQLSATSTSDLARTLELFVKLPVVDETGPTNHFKLTLKWNEGDKLTSAEQLNRSLDKIGLELVSSRRSIEMLVIEKVK